MSKPDSTVELVELVKQAMFDTVNSPTHEVDHFDIGRKFNAGNVQNEMANRIAARLQAILEREDAKARIEELEQMKSDWNHLIVGNPRRWIDERIAQLRSRLEQGGRE